MCFSSLEDTILAKHPIRFSDAFAEAIALEFFGFSVQTIKSKTVLQKKEAVQPLVSPKLQSR